MITTDGKNIVAKYLLNQAPEFASHIAIGVGGNAIATSDTETTFSTAAESLEFEVARVPILSKGLLREDGQEKIVFKAELPIEQRYQITEIGLYPAAKNAVAGNFDSRIISTFNNTEPWTYSNSINNSGTILYIGPVPIDPVNIGDIDVSNESWDDFVFINSNSSIFEYSDRINRGEQPRYLNRSMMVSGDTSTVTGTSGSASLINVSSSTSYYIENNSINLNLGKNLPTDKIKLAFSVVSIAREGVEALPPSNVKIRLEFLNNLGPSIAKSYVNIVLTDEDLKTIDEDREMRYQVVTKNLSEFTTTENFSWSSITGIRIYTCIHDDENIETGEHYVLYDGIRFENTSSYNPLYSLVAAEYIKTLDQNPVLKKENSISYIEYRFGIGVS
jgi:hypothetical protein